MMRRKPEQINLLPIAEDYFSNIFNQVPGMKALMLDQQTSAIISIIYTQSKLYKSSIYMIQKIDQQSQKIQHLKGLYLIRPTTQNIEILKTELRDPRFCEYHLFFTNQISHRHIEELASCDTNDKVKTFQQVYIDYLALSRNLFSLNIPSSVGLLKNPEDWEPNDRRVLNRMTEGLISLVMSLRLIPQIRFLNESQSCFKIAEALTSKIELQMNSKQSDFFMDQKAIVLITQRKEDVITPLLTPWTYQAMLHEFIGLYNNKVDIVNRQKSFLMKDANQYISLKQKQKREFVLSELSDEFYRNNINSGFGELANNIKSFISDVTQKRNKSLKLQSLQDMHNAIDNLPQLNFQSATLQKHLTLSCDIKDTIEKGLLFQVSKIEQDLVCQDSRNVSIDGIWKILKNEGIEFYTKMKLVLIFSVKYPNDKEIKKFLSFLSEINDDKSVLSLVNLLQQYQAKRKSDLFKESNIKKKAKCFFDRMMKDVPNVYTQHKPYFFEQVLQDLIAEKLKESDYPTIFHGKSFNSMYSKNRPIIILFFVGGVTYLQAKQAQKFDPAKVIVGGNFVHNSKTFLSEVIQMGGPDQQEVDI